METHFGLQTKWSHEIKCPIHSTYSLIKLQHYLFRDKRVYFLLKTCTVANKHRKCYVNNNIIVW